jgi:hypothetical protein
MVNFSGRFWLCPVRAKDGLTHWVVCTLDFYGKPSSDNRRLLCKQPAYRRKFEVDGYPTCLQCIVEGGFAYGA